MKIVIEKRTSTTEEVEIDFPVYFDTGDATDGGRWVSLHRVDADGTHWEITKRHNWRETNVEFQIERDKMDIRVSLGGWLDGADSATEEDFLELLAEARAFMDQIPCPARRAMNSMREPTVTYHESHSVVIGEPVGAIVAEPEPKRWRHRNGSTYTMVGPALAQTTKGICDYDAVVVYRAEEDGLLWVRPVEEFTDGRFTEI